MKIFTMVSDQSKLIVNDGFPVAQRFHKNKETGEKKFYPVGTYNVEKARSQFFFLNKSLQDEIVENDLRRIDNIIFKEHNNVSGLKIAFPAPKDSSAYLVFDGYKRENITFIADRVFREVPCPCNTKVIKSYTTVSSTENDTEYYCKYCGTRGNVAFTEEDASQLSTEIVLDKGIKAKKLVNKFFHLYNGDIHIYKEADYQVETFLDTFAVVINNDETIQFLLTNKDGSKIVQYLVEFTYHAGQTPNVAISLLENRGYTASQYNELVNNVKNFENSLRHSAPEETESQNVFYFPDKTEDYESPFESLRGIVGEDNE